MTGYFRPDNLEDSMSDYSMIDSAKPYMQQAAAAQSGINQARPVTLTVTLQELRDRLDKISSMSGELADRLRGTEQTILGGLLKDEATAPEAGDINSTASRLLRIVNRIEANTSRALNSL